MTKMLDPFQVIFDKLETFWERQQTQGFVATILVLVFVLSMLVIEFNRQQWLPEYLAPSIPLNHFHAVYLAFGLLLIIEVIGLVFALVKSVSDSVGKQFEIFSLILLRNSFKEFVHFDEPIHWLQVSEPVYHILSYATGALLIFLATGIYYRIQKHNPITKDPNEQTSFIAAKKLISLLLLFAFVGIGIYLNLRFILFGENFNFFNLFYTILIFTDILLVLVSIRYCSTYKIVFRNSGFALVTVVIRLALVAPPYYTELLGIGAVMFALGLTLVYNSFTFNNAGAKQVRP
jgi:hypothetical protein